MRRALGKAALALLLAATLSMPVPADAAKRCSKILRTGVRSPDALYFTAVAGTDTMRAGNGPVSYAPRSQSRDSLHIEKPIFGQVVRLKKIGGAKAEAVRQAGASGAGKAVLVPWGYRADCEPTLWHGSVQWMPPGTTGFFHTAELRPREHWVQGLPTFDVLNAYHEPYPHAESTKRDLMNELGLYDSLRTSVRAHLPADTKRALRSLQQSIDVAMAVIDSAETEIYKAMADTISVSHPDSLPQNAPDSLYGKAFEAWGLTIKRARRACPKVAARLDTLTRRKFDLKSNTLRQRLDDAVRRAPLPMDSLLSPREYFSLYRALPHYTGSGAYRELSSLEPLKWWRRKYPEAAQQHPAPEIIEMARRHARKEEQ